MESYATTYQPKNQDGKHTPNKPSFFIVGNSKSGTTALYAFLSPHPGIFMSRPKEPNYFAKDFCQGVTVGAFREKTEQKYLAYFAGTEPHKICGEASACYLYSKVAAEEIFKFNPSAKIIILLREPVSFLHSYHMQLLKNPTEDGENVKDFEAALNLEEDRKAGRNIPEGCLVPPLLFYSERIKYAEQVERYLRLFGRENVKVFIYEDFKKNNASIYKEVLDFLGLQPEVMPDFQSYNRGAMLRSKTLQNWFGKLTHGKGWMGPIKNLITSLLPKSLRRTLTRMMYRRVIFRPKPELDPALTLRLKRAFKPEVEKLSRLLDRDLSALWGYRDI